MHSLQPITALGGTVAQTDTRNGVTCSEVPGIALASVAARMGREAQCVKAFKSLTGVEAPPVAQFAGKGPVAFWVGPDQWMLEAPFETHEELAAIAKAKLKNNASVTEQTDAWTRFDLDGDRVLDVLELLCKLDTRTMAAGSAQRSTIEQLGCFILCRDEGFFSLYGPRSSAGSLHHAITTAMRSAL